MLEINTFGNSPCAENLVKILNELNNDKFNHKTSSFLGSNNELIKKVDNLSDEKMRRSLLNMLRKEIPTTTIELPEKVKTHAINILVGKLRDCLNKEI